MRAWAGVVLEQGVGVAPGRRGLGGGGTECALVMGGVRVATPMGGGGARVCGVVVCSAWAADARLEGFKGVAGVVAAGGGGGGVCGGGGCGKGSRAGGFGGGQGGWERAG